MVHPGCYHRILFFFGPGEHSYDRGYRTGLVGSVSIPSRPNTLMANRVTSIAQGDSNTLTLLNTYIRRIDLLSKLLAPVSHDLPASPHTERRTSFSYPY